MSGGTANMVSAKETGPNGILSKRREEKGKRRSRLGWEVLLDWAFVGCRVRTKWRAPLWGGCTANCCRLWWAERSVRISLRGNAQFLFKKQLFLSSVYWLMFFFLLLWCPCHVCSLGSVFQFSTTRRFQAALLLSILRSFMKFKI